MKTKRTPKEHLEWIGIRGSRWAWATLISIVAFFGSLAYAPGRPVPAPNHARPAVPLMESTTDAAPRALGSTPLPDDFPNPNPLQKQKGQCDPEASEVEINGGCWIQTTHSLPCPKNKQWEYDKKCWRPVFRAARPPTTGEPQNTPIATPQE